MYEKTNPRPNPIYLSRAWKKLRREILEMDRHECQTCRAKGRYTRAEQVHHVKTIETHPELAMEKTYTDETGEHRQLISLCRECHMKAHDYQHMPKEPLTREMW